MSNTPEQQPGELANLDPLPELPAEVSAAPVSAAEAPAGRAPRPSGVPSAANLAARAQEKAPQLLKKAARVLVIGSLLPWMPVTLAGNGQLVNFALKLLLLLGCWLILKGVDAHFQGAAAVGFGKRSILPGKKGVLGALNGLHVIGTLLIVAILIVQIAVLDDLKVLGESLTLLLGGLTFAHIDSYEKGGKFNPLFPLMFLGCALGGLAGLVGGINNGKWFAVLGSIVVTAAGVLAVYTIAVAMMQAKKDGDIKKAAALEARKQARVTKR